MEMEYVQVIGMICDESAHMPGISAAVETRTVIQVFVKCMFYNSLHRCSIWVGLDRAVHGSELLREMDALVNAGYSGKMAICSLNW